MEFAPVYLKKREERRLKSGHPWLYSNEIDTGRSPLKGFLPGQPVQVRTFGNDVVGHGYINPSTLISVRLMTRGEDAIDLKAVVEERLAHALAMRDHFFEAPFYRMVFGEGDALPGLVVDRYNDVLVAQISTAGMENLTDVVVESLTKLVNPSAIVLRNDVSSRQLEGLESSVTTVMGEAPEKVEVREGEARFEISPLAGQKTGWYFDHRNNREWLHNRVDNGSVLDLFSYVGAWGLGAAVNGASQVTCVDSGEAAIAAIENNARLNDVESRVETIRGDAIDVIKDLRKAGRKFDTVIVDPPAFIKRRKDIKAGVEAYRRLYGLAMQLVRSGGLMVSASCSYHFDRDKHIETLARVARGNRQHVQIIGEGGCAIDHPIHPALPEMAYLKTFFLRASDQ